MEFRRATKDHYEQETNEAERLVRPAPKVKPKRTDLRREEMQTDRDPDTDTDPDTKRDPDLSLNYKSVGGSQRVVARFLQADLDRKDLVKVRKKDTGNVTYVSKKRLQEEGGDYEVVDDEGGGSGEEPDKGETPPSTPEDKKGPSSEDAPDRVDAVKALNHEMQTNQPFGQALKKMFGPKGDLSGLPQEYPVAKIKGLAQHPVLNQFKTLGDIRDALLDTSHVSKPQKGAPKNKTPEPAAPKAPPAQAPKEPQEAPPAKEAPKAGPPANGVPEGSPPPATAPSEGVAPEAGPEKAPKEESAPESAPEENAEGKEEEKPKKKPNGKGKGKDKKPEEFSRREFTQGEADRAKIQLITTFPPDVARNLIRQNLHPDDVTELMSAYHTAKAANPKTLGDALDMVGGGKAYQPDPSKITRTPRFGQDSTGAELPFESLTPEDQHKATQKYRMQLAATSLAARTAVVNRLKAKADVPEELLSRIADFGLTKLEGETPEQRLERAQKASKEVFGQTLASGFAYENRADNSRWEAQRNEAIQEHENEAKAKGEEYDPDLDTDLPSIPPGEHKEVSETQITKLLSSLDGDPGAQQIAVGFLQAADYMDAQERFLNSSSSSEAMTEHQPPKKIWSGVQKAMGFFQDQAKRYPEALRWANDPAASFRNRVLDKVRTLAPEKYPFLQKWNEEYEDEDYDRKQKEWDKAFSEKKPYREQGVKPPPRPMEPPGYASRHGEKKQSRSQSRKLLNDLQRQWGKDEGAKTASSVVLRFLRYSSYPLGVTMGSSADSTSKTAVYGGVQPYPKGHEGFAPYTKWTQVHQRDLTETDYSGIVASAREWLRMPVLSTDVEGIVRDTQLRAALDLAIRTHEDGRYSVGLQPPVYNRLLAKLAGKPQDETLLTVQAAVRSSLSKKACGGSCGGCASCGNASENHVSVYAPTGEEPPMKASAQVRKFAAQVASTNPTVAYELIDLATKLAQQEEEGQQASQDQKQGGEVPPQFLEHMKKKDDDKGEEKKDDDKKEAKQAAAAYTALRSHVIRQAHANPHIREAYQPLLETIKRLG